MELGTTLPIFLYPLSCYQTRQGLNCVILHAILHVCKTGSVTWTWHDIMRASEKRVVKRIFPQNRKKTTEYWRKVQGEGVSKIFLLA